MLATTYSQLFQMYNLISGPALKNLTTKSNILRHYKTLTLNDLHTCEMKVLNSAPQF